MSQVRSRARGKVAPAAFEQRWATASLCAREAAAAGKIQLAESHYLELLKLANNVTLDVASTNLFDVSASTNDQLRVVGDLTPNGSVITVNLGGAYLGASTNVLITYTGTKTGSFASVP